MGAFCLNARHARCTETHLSFQFRQLSEHTSDGNSTFVGSIVRCFGFGFYRASCSLTLSSRFRPLALGHTRQPIPVHCHTTSAGDAEPMIGAMTNSLSQRSSTRRWLIPLVLCGHANLETLITTAVQIRISCFLSSNLLYVGGVPFLISCIISRASCSSSGRTKILWNPS